MAKNSNSHFGKSPKFRMNQKREAEKDERKAKPTTTDWKSSVQDVFKKKKNK